MFIKICCVSTIDEADAAIETNASAIGLVSSMPNGPGIIADDLIARIACHARSRIETFLLTSRMNASSIVEQHKHCQTSALQLVADISIDTVQALRDTLRSVKLVKVIHVRDESAVASTKSYEPFVDMLLLDSSMASDSGAQLGGTGVTHDWSISERICGSVKVPVLLAGGLRAGNLRTALTKVRPFGVDVCSGVRTADRLDRAKLQAFVTAARESI